MLRALDGVRRIDAVGYSMVVELMRGEFEVAAWRASLGCSDATVTDKKYLAIYRYSVFFFDVLQQLEPLPRAALEARRFSPGNAADGDALAALRESLRRPRLGLAELRDLYRTGASDVTRHPCARRRPGGGIHGATRWRVPTCPSDRGAGLR